VRLAEPHLTVGVEGSACGVGRVREAHANLVLESKLQLVPESKLAIAVKASALPLCNHSDES
jgi:hypothetical protein